MNKIAKSLRLLILGLLLFALIVGVYLVQMAVRYRSKAAVGSIDAYFISSPLSLGDILVKIIIDPKGQNISFARIAFKFDPAKVELKNEITNSALLTKEIEKTLMTDANLNGQARIVQAVAPTLVSPSTVFEIASFTLKTKSTLSNDTARLDFDTGDLEVISNLKENLSINAAAKTLTLNPVSSTPTKAPSVAPTVTPAPVTFTPTPASSLRPTATKVPIPTPTSAPQKTISRDSFATRSAKGLATNKYNVSHTVTAGTNNVLVVSVSHRAGGGLPTSVVWNSTESLTMARGENSIYASSLITSSIWYLKAPTPGTYDVTITWPSNINNVVVGIATYHGVNQTTPVDASTGRCFDSTSTTPSASITTNTAGAWIIENLAMRTSASETATSGIQTNRTERWNLLTASNGLRGAGTTIEPKASAGSQTLNWTTTNARPTCLVAIALKPI